MPAQTRLVQLHLVQAPREPMFIKIPVQVRSAIAGLKQQAAPSHHVAAQELCDVRVQINLAARNALVELETRKSEFTLITQNVDGLHELAGSKNLLKLHGDIWLVRCTKCGAAWVDRHPSLPEIPPHCLCGALARPGVVWFGEPLPKRVIDEATQAVKSSEILLVIGTSAIVYPAAGLIPLAKGQGRTVIEINPDETPCSDMADCSLHGPAGEILPRLVGSKSNRPKEGGVRARASLKTFGEMSELEIRTMASWLRSKLEGRASPLTLSRLSDEELVMRYLREAAEKIKHARQKEAEK